MSEADEVELEIKQELEKQVVDIEKIEEIARKQGWSPEKGEKSALEFLEDGREYRDRLYKKVEKLEKDNEKAYGVIADYIHSQKKKEHTQEQQSIEDQIRAATEEGDTEKVLQLTKKLKTEPDPNLQYTEQWASEHKWFHENPEMRDDALGFYQAELLKFGRDDPKAILPKVEERIKKLYSTYFNPENPNKDRGAGAEKSGKQKSSSEGISMVDLTDEERRHVKDFVAMGMDEKRILRSIQNARR